MITRAPDRLSSHSCATRSQVSGGNECFNIDKNTNYSNYNITECLDKNPGAGDAPRSKKRSRQSGVALITAILVVALASIAASAILVSADIAIRRTTNLQDSEKAWWYAEGVEDWVKTILQRDSELNKTDSFADIWATPETLPVDEGVLRGHVEDLQGRFNLNNFGVPDLNRYQVYVTQFERLLQNIDGADPFMARPLAAAIRDWIDADSVPTPPDGAEDTEYLVHVPPYRTPNRPMESVSEVLAVKGMTKDLYYKLTHCAMASTGPVSCITALPQYPTPINVNTAPEPVLQSLVRQPSQAIEAFVKLRVTQPLTSPSQVFQAPPAGFVTAADGTTQDMVSVTSSYFLLKAEAFIGSGRVALYSFYYRPAQGPPVVLGHSTDSE
ncbi:MAG: type II secretion system minor pseudopilin GspK [Stenotrophobium sp.]